MAVARDIFGNGLRSGALGEVDLDDFERLRGAVEEDQVGKLARGAAYKELLGDRKAREEADEEEPRRGSRFL